MPNKYKKILIIRTGAIGDVVHTTNLVHSIKKYYPDVQIDYMTKELVTFLPENDKDIERVINTFNANYDNSISSIVDGIVDDVFNNVKLTPVECTTFNIDYDGKEVPYNFILSDNALYSALS